MALTMTPRPHTDRGWPGWLPDPRLLDLSFPWRQVFDDDDPIRIEEYRDGDTLVIRAEMPGIDPDRDVEIVASDHVLSVTAERRQESKTEGRTGYRSEFHYGSFSRTVPLPAGTTEDDVAANYRDGILEVRVPIDGAEAKARRVPVTRGEA